MAVEFNIPTNFVEKDVPRSTRDLSSNRITSILPCLHIPLFFAEQLPEDVFKSRVSTVLMSNPFQTPYFGRFKFRVSAFQCPLTNYYGWMDNNTRQKTDAIKKKRHWTVCPRRISDMIGNTDIIERMFPLWKAYGRIASVIPSYIGNTDANSPSEDILPIMFSGLPLDSSVDYLGLLKIFQKAFGVRAGSLLQYFGMPNGYMYSRYVDGTEASIGTDGYSFNADRILAYLDVVRSYMTNNQLDSIPYFLSGFDYDIKSDLTDSDGIEPFYTTSARGATNE